MALSQTPIAERVVFESVLEGLFLKALRPRLTPKLRSRLLNEVQIDLQALPPAIAYATWLKCMEVAADELYPSHPREEAFQELGCVLVRGFFETLVGRALRGMVQLLGAKRTLLRMDRNLRNGNNYSETRLTELGPAHYELWCNEGGIMRYSLMGIVREGLAVTGVKDLRVTIARTDGESVTFDVSWALE